MSAVRVGIATAMTLLFAITGFVNTLPGIAKETCMCRAGDGQHGNMRIYKLVIKSRLSYADRYSEIRAFHDELKHKKRGSV